MSRVKFGKWEYSDEELKAQFAKATQDGEKAMRAEPQARSVHYDRSSSRIIIDLKNGATFIVPCELLQGLSEASPDDIAEVELGPRGAALHWEKLDVDFSLEGLMSGRFGSKSWMLSAKTRIPRPPSLRRNDRQTNRRKTGT